MKTNVGSYDGAVRFVVGCLLLGLGIHFENAWFLLGLIPIATALASFCPLYLLLHIDTTAVDGPHFPAGH